MHWLLAQTTTNDLGGQIITGLGSGGVVGTIAYLMFKALLLSHQAHIASLTKQLDVANDSHGKHLEKEGLIVQALNGLTTAVETLRARMEDALFADGGKRV